MLRAFATLAISLVLVTAAGAETYDAVIEESAPLRVTIEGRTVRLEALVVKPVTDSTRLPIALMPTASRTPRAA